MSPRWAASGVATQRSAAALLVALTGCSLTTELDGLSRGATGGAAASVAGSGATTSASSSSVSVSVSASSGSGGAGGEARDGGSDAAGGGGSGGCTSTGGPAMVEVNAGPFSFCIDSTEVTRAQYLEFLKAKGNDASGQPPECAWNLTFTPIENWPPSLAQEQLPVGSVDWCDAYAFCVWAGKRLCGAIAGGPNDFAAPSNALASQWYHACSHGGDGQHAYVYGNTFVDGACNTYKSANQTSVPVASLPACEGGYPGIFDMSGNVEEWEDACDGAIGAADLCHRRGGSWADFDYVKYTSCAEPYSPAASRSQPDGDVGFRCCSR